MVSFGIHMIIWTHLISDLSVLKHLTKFYKLLDHNVFSTNHISSAYEISKFMSLYWYIFGHEINWLVQMLKFPPLNTSKSTQNGQYFPEEIFDSFCFNDNVRTVIPMSLKFVPTCKINRNHSMIHTMAWHRTGYRPSLGTMWINLPTHMYYCVD